MYSLIIRLVFSGRGFWTFLSEKSKCHKIRRRQHQITSLAHLIVRIQSNLKAFKPACMCVEN